MYSNIDIKEALENSDLIIEPFNKKIIKPAGITLHLGDTLLIQQAGKTVDVKKKITPDYKKVIISKDDPYTLKPGEFLLSHTLEKVSVSKNIGFLIEGRSTLARVGLTVVQTAMLIYPGHTSRCITLELANHSPSPINLYKDMKIARAVIIGLKTPSTILYDENGKYRNQESVGVPIFDNEFKDY